MEIKNNYFLANRKLIKNIFQITLPAVFDLLAQTLIMAFDMKMVSSLGASAISSVGVGTAGMFALIPALIAVATGTTALLVVHMERTIKLKVRRHLFKVFL